MTPLTKFLNKRERSIKSLKNKITKNEEKIDKLKTKIKLKRGRYHKNDKNAQSNVEKRKKIKRRNNPLESPNTKIQKRNQRTHILQRKKYK